MGGYFSKSVCSTKKKKTLMLDYSLVNSLLAVTRDVNFVFLFSSRYVLSAVSSLR